MPDHINISHPSEYGIQSDFYLNKLKLAQLRIEIEQLCSVYRSVSDNLDSIFTRIGRGESVELHYPDGTVRTVAEVADGKPAPKAADAKPPRQKRRTKAEVEAAKAAATVDVKPGNAEVAARIGVSPEIPDFLRRAPAQAAE